MKSDNELIAEFMGFTFANTRENGNERIYHVPSGEALNFKAYKLSHLKFNYDTSWDWLMPVVEKISEPDVKSGKIIRSLADVKIFYKACIIHYEPDEDFEDREEKTIQTKGESKLEAVYKAVVEFIKWVQSKR